MRSRKCAAIYDEKKVRDLRPEDHRAECFSRARYQNATRNVAAEAEMKCEKKVWVWMGILINFFFRCRFVIYWCGHPPFFPPFMLCGSRAGDKAKYAIEEFGIGLGETPRRRKQRMNKLFSPLSDSGASVLGQSHCIRFEYRQNGIEVNWSELITLYRLITLAGHCAVG